MNNFSPLGAIRQRWWIVVLMALVGAVFGALPQAERVEEEVEHTYDATHTLLLNETSGEQALGATISPNQVTLFTTTGDVPLRVAEAIDYDGNAATLANTVISFFDASTGALTITTTQGSPAQAELVADTFAFELTSYLAERQDVVYQDRLAASLERLSVLEAELQSLNPKLTADPTNAVLTAQQGALARQYSVAFEQSALLEATPAVIGFTTLQSAQAVDTSIDGGLSAPTSRLSRGLIGMIVGAALGAGLAIALGQLDRRIRTREQAETVVDMRARVMIPKVGDADRDKLIVVKGRHEPLADAYRTVRNVVGFVLGPAEPNDPARVTLVVSPGPGDGKTSLAVNLAAAMAENGQRTILINTDFRRPRLASAVSSQPLAPLPFSIHDLKSLEPATLLVKTNHTRLMLLDLSTVDGTPGELVRATVEKLEGLRGVSDSIVIDSSPVGSTAEVLELIPQADAIVVVSRIGHTAIAAAQRTMAILRDLATVPMVFVLGGEKFAKSQYYEYTDRPKAGRGRSKWRGRKSGSKKESELESV